MRLAPPLALAAAAVALSAVACSVEEGVGSARGELDAPDCWQGPFDLNPDFFGGQPYRETYGIRVQRGSDFATFADALSVLVDDIGAIRPQADGSSLYGRPLPVGLSPAVVPPGTPVVADPDPPLVHATLALQTTCRTQNTTLYAVRAVSLGPDGRCVGAAAVPEKTRCAPGAAPATASSTITFASLFNGNASETNAKERLTDATFDLYLADPREICPGGGPPPPCRGHLQGAFRFYFSRSRPAQAFP